jgi:hypothetical protein
MTHLARALSRITGELDALLEHGAGELPNDLCRLIVGARRAAGEARDAALLLGDAAEPPSGPYRLPGDVMDLDGVT